MESKINEWINYKLMFFIMYGKHIYEHYKNDPESVKVLKYEILYM